VTAIQHTSPAVVSTQHGQVTARYVIVAGNAYLGDKIEPELAKRSMPCGTQVVTTAPLPEEVARTLIPNNYCVEDCNYLLDYYRLTADNRLLYGGGVVRRARSGRCRASGDAKAAENLPSAGRGQNRLPLDGQLPADPVAYAAVWSSG
jgi:glycine/D-amino acid oxidase-like deaminating enzyme